MSVIRLAGLIIGSISFLLLVISLAIPYWIYTVDKEVQVAGSNLTFFITANIGFWDYCSSTDFNGYTGSRCGKFYESNRNDITDASAAMLLLGMLLMAGSVVVCGTSILCMKESKLFPIVGGVCAFFSVIGLAIPYWIYMAGKEVSVPGSDMNFTINANIGFWDYCVSVEFYGVLHRECGKLYESNRSNMTDASAAMLLIGMLMLAGSMVVCVTSTLCMKENKRLPIVGGVCALFAGICVLIGVALYGYEYREEIFIENVNLGMSHMYGPSFYMAVGATVLALVSGNIQIAYQVIFTKPNII